MANRVDGQDAEKVKERLVIFEIKALTTLLERLAVKEIEFSNWAAKIQKLRRVVREPEYNMNTFEIAFELTYDEYKLAHYAANRLCEAFPRIRKRFPDAESLKSFKIIHKVKDVQSDQNIEIKRPFPLVMDSIDDFLREFKREKGPSEIAYDLVGYRFNKGPETIRKNNKRRNKNLPETDLVWRLLATCFLDLNSENKDGNQAIQAKILDTLFLTGYSRFKLYYLVQAANIIDDNPIIGKWDECMIDKLCAICLSNHEISVEKQSGPFSQSV